MLSVVKKCLLQRILASANLQYLQLTCSFHFHFFVCFMKRFPEISTLLTEYCSMILFSGILFSDVIVGGLLLFFTYVVEAFLEIRVYFETHL